MPPRRRRPAPGYTIDHDARWRPKARGPVCGYVFDDKICQKKGAHYCEPRADRVVAFFSEILVHTKGRWARQAFILEDWQEHEIVRPVFGEVIWSDEWQCYHRRFTVVYIVVARKNGKSDLAAGLVHVLLVGDDEEAAEIYGAAKDTKQAGKVGEVVERMRLLSPDLRERLAYNKNARRISDEKTASYYEVITADALGELGHNPHGFVLDEVLSQPDDQLWESLRTADGTRVQPLFLLVTTETNNPASFGADMIDEAERIVEDPARTPHAFAFVRKMPRTDEELDRLHRLYPGHPRLPVSTDVFDERNWYWPNPALGSFLTVESMRKSAIDARNEPAKENGYRQYKLNQRVSQVTRWIPMHLWDRNGPGLLGEIEGELADEACFAGLDLASTTDLAAWVLFFPSTSGRHRTLWRFYTPEAQIPALDSYTAGKASVWVREGLLVATEGDWIDYDVIHRQIEKDAADFRVVKVGFDQKEAASTAQFMQRLDLEIEPVYQGFSLSPSLKELMRMVKAEMLDHAGHPVARWNADSADIKTDDQERIKLVKPKRQGSGKRIDGLAALANAINVWQFHDDDVSEPWVVAG